MPRKQGRYIAVAAPLESGHKGIRSRLASGCASGCQRRIGAFLLQPMLSKVMYTYDNKLIGSTISHYAKPSVTRKAHAKQNGLTATWQFLQNIANCKSSRRTRLRSSAHSTDVGALAAFSGFEPACPSASHVWLRSCLHVSVQPLRCYNSMFMFYVSVAVLEQLHAICFFLSVWWAQDRWAR